MSTNRAERLDVSIQEREVINVLSLSPVPADHRSLEDLLFESRFSNRDWFVKTRLCFSNALSDLRTTRVAIVLCDDALPWRDLLDKIQELPRLPRVIVTSRLADQRLWSEAMSLSAWDVLTKPYQRKEAVHSLKLAWLHWHHQLEMPIVSERVMKAVGLR